MREYAGIAEIVLSQLRIFTVVSEMSSTVPSVLPSSSSQSPTFTVSFAEIIIPAVKPRSASRKTSRRTAVSAPKPDRKYIGDLSERIDKIQIAAPRPNASFIA